MNNLSKALKEFEAKIIGKLQDTQDIVVERLINDEFQITRNPVLGLIN